MTYSINPPTTALLIIDAQREYFDVDGNLFTSHASTIQDSLVRVRDAAQAAGATVVYVKHVHRASGADVGRMGDFDDTEVFGEGTVGVDIIEALSPGSDDVIVTKNRYSAFVNTELESILRGSGIDTVVIGGLMTQFCSVSTARHAHDLDYKVIFLADANAGPDLPGVTVGDTTYDDLSHEESLRAVICMLGGGVADVKTSDETIALLEGG